MGNYFFENFNGIYIKTVYGAGYCLELPIGSQIEIARQEFIQARNPNLINSAVD